MMRTHATAVKEIALNVTKTFLDVEQVGIPCFDGCKGIAADAIEDGTREILEVLKEFLNPPYSMGASHPHLGAYVAYDNPTWSRAKQVLAKWTAPR